MPDDISTLKCTLRELVGRAFASIAGSHAESGWVDPQLHTSKHADFQADAAMRLAKLLGRAPQNIAESVASLLSEQELFESVKVAAPGFLNLTLSNTVIEKALKRQLQSERLGVPAITPKIIVVDYSSPNVAKEMHVGHLRSTIIGDACVRLMEWIGHTVIRRNHIGDWGTPFGMLIEHLLDIGESVATEELSVGDLNEFYRDARRKFESDQVFQRRARSRVVSLQAGDEVTLRLWRILIEQSKTYFTNVYEKLDVRLDGTEYVGESAYNDKLNSTLDELRNKDLIRDSSGAACLFPEGFTNRSGDPLPLIVRKSDGGFGYAATDITAIRQRALDIKADRILYVVGNPQSQHLDMIFEAAREAGWLASPVRAEHISFGSVLGTDGKMLKSRAGDTIKLTALLDEAIRRANQILAEKNPEIEHEDRADIANAVGIGAIKYADLSSERSRDYVFDYDRMLAFEGNTAPYLQYAHTRVCSILRRTNHISDYKVISIGTDVERDLAFQLTHFPDIVSEIEDNLQFHHLAHYLYKLATLFSVFYDSCPVLSAQESLLRDSRLALCQAVAQTIKTGLGILGIRAPERM